MTWIRPQQGSGGGGGGGGTGTGVVFIARVSTQGPVVLVGGAPSVVDAVGLTVGDVVLVRFQVMPFENGLYQVDIVGGGATGTWTRIATLSTSAQLDTFALVKVREGLVDADHEFILITDPPYVIGVTPLTFTMYPPGMTVSSAILSWGNDAIGTTTTTRFLTPWYSDTLAQTTAIRWRAPRAGTAKNLRVRHNTTAGNGNSIVYTLRVNGVASALTVSLASTGSDASDLVNTVAIAAGDLLDLIVTKALSIAGSPSDITAVMEFS